MGTISHVVTIVVENNQTCKRDLSFRDEKSGEDFNADDALEHVFNCADCNIGSCPIGKRVALLQMDCCAFVESHPAEAARLMGLTVIENSAGGESRC